MTLQCCKCKRIRVEDRWVAVDALPDGMVSHTYCPPCLLEAHVAMFNERASTNERGEARAVSMCLAGAAAN